MTFARFLVYGILGCALAANGLTPNKLGFWAIMVCVIAIDVLSRLIGMNN